MKTNRLALVTTSTPDMVTDDHMPMLREMAADGVARLIAEVPGATLLGEIEYDGTGMPYSVTDDGEKVDPIDGGVVMVDLLWRATASVPDDFNPAAR